MHWNLKDSQKSSLQTTKLHNDRGALGGSVFVLVWRSSFEQSTKVCRCMWNCLGQDQSKEQQGPLHRLLLVHASPWTRPCGQPGQFPAAPQRQEPGHYCLQGLQLPRFGFSNWETDSVLQALITEYWVVQEKMGWYGPEAPPHPDPRATDMAEQSPGLGFTTNPSLIEATPPGLSDHDAVSVIADSCIRPYITRQNQRKCLNCFRKVNWDGLRQE